MSRRDLSPDDFDGLAAFFKTYRLYRKGHPRFYSLRIAYQIEFLGMPF